MPRPFFWYEKAAAQCHALALYNLGNMYYFGRGVAVDHARAYEHYEKAVQDSFNTAELKPYLEYFAKKDKIGQCYLGWLLVRENSARERGVNLLTESAGQGFAPAQYYLGEVCSINKQLHVAVKWYKNAAGQGYTPAQYRMGVHYELGTQVKQDLKQARAYYEMAARQGYAHAQYGLGRLYYDGRGGRQNYALAARWFLKAAERRHGDAQNELAEMYYKGLGVPVDHMQAYVWYNLAALFGSFNESSQVGLSVLKRVLSASELVIAEKMLLEKTYAMRQPEIVKYRNVRERLEKAAESGDLQAQCELARLYCTGEQPVMVRDFHKAVFWYTRAAKHGFAPARQALDKIHAEDKALAQNAA